MTHKKYKLMRINKAAGILCPTCREEASLQALPKGRNGAFSSKAPPCKRCAQKNSGRKKKKARTKKAAGAK